MSDTYPKLDIAKIKVVGLGGAGCHSISQMVRQQMQGIEFIAIDTDAQALSINEAPTKIQIGMTLTKGLGTQGKPLLGTKAAEDGKEQIRSAVSRSDMVFIVAGMGGGTGTGGAPFVARTAKKSGALTVGIVFRPFTFEGIRRKRLANEGISLLRRYCDALIIVSNDRALTICSSKVLTVQVYKTIDDVIKQAIESIADIINIPATINVDFSDVKAVMKNAGLAWVSIARAGGYNRAVDAAKAAISSPLLDVSIEGARGVLFNVTGGENLTLHEVNEAAKVISMAAHPNAKIIFGVRFDPAMNNEIKIIIIATRFGEDLKTKVVFDTSSSHRSISRESLQNLPAQTSVVNKALKEIPKKIAPTIAGTEIATQVKLNEEKRDLGYRWHFFISHATEDKEVFVRQLAKELELKGLKVWYDDFTLNIGDSLRRSIDKGITSSRYGIVVLSHNFFAKELPQKELDGLASLERNGRKVILPIWLDVDAEDVKRYSPILADRLAAKTKNGLEKVINDLLRVLR